MKIAICDDDKQEILLISKLMNEYLSWGFPKGEIEFNIFEKSTELSAQIESDKHNDIFLLDIIMPDINGIELAEQIRSKDKVAKIIFLTSSPEFAIDSYSVFAFNYLLKPIQKDKLFSVLEEACSDLYSTLKKFIVVKTQNNLSKVFFHKIIYVEVIGRTLYLHLNDELIIESIGTISQIEALLLVDKRFVKPHRSFIVNLDFIKELSQEGFMTKNDLLIPISRSSFKKVKQAYINYTFEPIKGKKV